MEDPWLDKIQQRAQVERLLESFATRSGLLPDTAYRIRDPETLRDELRQVLAQARAHVWVCFSNGSQSWLFTGMVWPALSLVLNAPVLLVNSYSEQGTLIDIGAWTVDPDGKWRRCAD